jgi:hypothetical protein
MSSRPCVFARRFACRVFGLSTYDSCSTPFVGLTLLPILLGIHLVSHSRALYPYISLCLAKPHKMPRHDCIYTRNLDYQGSFRVEEAILELESSDGHQVFFCHLVASHYRCFDFVHLEHQSLMAVQLG